jgi:hypothetical protein
MKIAYYCIGNFSEFLYHSSKVSKHESSFYVQNFKGREFFSSLSVNIPVYYQYQNFNKVHAVLEKNVCPLNYNVIFQADKSHFKKHCSGSDVRDIIDTFYNIFQNIISEDKPDFIFFPIIESLDAMVLYELAKAEGIGTIVYSHARVLPLSFLSSSKYEDFPQYFYKNRSSNTTAVRSLLALKSENSRIKNQMRETIYEIDATNVGFSPTYPSPLKRFLKNLYYQFTLERYNACLSNWVKFQVYFEKTFVKIGMLIYDFVEKFIIKPISHDEYPLEYNCFPLHFSPESSINTPAPFYIDQERVIDRILLSSKKPLLLREHPALFGKRKLSFYRAILKKPNVYFTKVNDNIHDLIDRSDTVFSVTGTVIIEAFFKGKKFEQFGKNYFSYFIQWCDENAILMENRPQTLVNIIINNASRFIVLPHSSRNPLLNEALFSLANIQTFNQALDIHVENCKKTIS